MSEPDKQSSPMTVQQFTDALIRVALVFLLVVAALRVFNPFIDLMLWSLILAVTIYPLHQSLAAKFGGKQGRAASAIVLLGIMLIGVPVALLGVSLAEELAQVYDRYDSGTIAIKAPAESVKEWPVIGEKAYQQWSAAAANLPAFIEENKATFEALAGKALAIAKNTAGDVLFFIGALIVAGVMMAFGRSGSDATRHILCRIAGEEQGPRVHTLVTMTTRSVAAGVLGVAVIQAVLLGVGFMLAQVPAAGILAVVVLLLAIMQLPATLVTLPIIIWLWNSGEAGTVMNIVWTVYFILAGLSDNVLKPMLLGRGVDAPMPVILIGALGGMVSRGFIGLFIGAVVLAVAYQIFMQWVAMHNTGEKEDAAPASTEAGE